jgi:5-hydroxyisourate hydrolase
MKRLTTHVLDTANGVPGAGIKVELFAIGSERCLIKSTLTNTDGRTDEPLLDETAFEQGVWELDFHVAEYFRTRSGTRDQTPFLDRVTLRFGIGTDGHYHVPLLVSPWSYSTYRGS